MKVDENNKPPVGGMGGCIHDWERGKDPWHKDAFPSEFKDVGTEGEQKGGWFALDGAGNQISFVPDGTIFEEKEEK